MSTNKYQLKITTKASEDLDEIYAYISSEINNETAALNLLGEIEKNYITFYIVNEKDKRVIIMRVLYGGQNYQDII